MQIGDKVRVKANVPYEGGRVGRLVKPDGYYAHAWEVKFDDEDHEMLFYESELELVSSQATILGIPYTIVYISSDGTTTQSSANVERRVTTAELLKAAQGDSQPTQWNDECLNVWIGLMANVKEVAK